MIIPVVILISNGTLLLIRLYVIIVELLLPTVAPTCTTSVPLSDPSGIVALYVSIVNCTVPLVVLCCTVTSTVALIVLISPDIVTVASITN